MPVYNGLPYLQEAIESVLSQTFADFEFLIVDDASTDKSVACIRSYKDSRIRLVPNERNLGQTGSLNKGLQLAQGIYIARLDQDDVCLPERLRRQVAFLQHKPDVVALCSWEYSIDACGRKVRSWRSQLENYGAFLGTLLIGNCPIWHPSIMFRRQIVAELGGYDESYAPAEDFDLWVRIAMRRYNASIVPEYLVLQRVHEGRQSIKKGTIQMKHMQHCHDTMVKTFCNGRESELVARLLRLEDSFWSQCESKSQLRVVLDTLNEMLANVKALLGLSPSEFASLKRVVYRRLGLGVKLGRKLIWLPTVLFYPIFLGFSPMLIPRVRRVSSFVYEKLQELRCPARLIQLAFERSVNKERIQNQG